MLKKILIIAVISLFIIPYTLFADEAATLDEALILSAQTGKPILLEFVRSD